VGRVPWQCLGEPTIQIKINGTQGDVDAETQMPLLWAIRDIIGLTGTKFGCGARPVKWSRTRGIGILRNEIISPQSRSGDRDRTGKLADGVGRPIGRTSLLGFHVGFGKLPFAETAETPNFAPDAFVSIDETGLVTIVANRSEMGTGIKTDLPLVLADELEADWSRVKVVQAPGDPKYGDQNTDGSRSTWQFFGLMWLAGATARQMLETAASQTWNVPAEECRAHTGFVEHAASGRKLAFGGLAKLAALMPMPPADQVRLKDPKDWRSSANHARSST
jgi:hypothetical protein